MNDLIFPSKEKLIKYQEQMQSDSDWILSRIDLIKLLSDYGEVKIVGAKALGLMIARNIDISVIVPKMDALVWQEIVSKLMVTKHIRKVTAVDEFNYDESNKYDPENGKKYSLYIEMDTLLGPDQDKHNSWEVQIHLITKEKFDEDIIKNIKSKIDDENRIIILKLKWWANEVNKDLLFKSNGHFKIQSTLIYEAVLNNNNIRDVSSLVGFLRQRINKEYIKYINIFNVE